MVAPNAIIARMMRELYYLPAFVADRLDMLYHLMVREAVGSCDSVAPSGPMAAGGRLRNRRDPFRQRGAAGPDGSARTS